MIDVKGFAFVAVLVLLAATLLAQPILLEINTNFTAHKLEPSGSFVSKSLKIVPPKSIAGMWIYQMRVPLLSTEGISKTTEPGGLISFPFKSFAVEISKKRPLKFATVSMQRVFSGEVEVSVPLSLNFPTIVSSQKIPEFADAFRKVQKFKVEDLNVEKEISVSIASWESKHLVKNSVMLLEMKKKVSAYSPLGGLETIGKYLEENKYAFWANQDHLGMEMDTPLMSNWVAYDYNNAQISNLSLAFNAGPFSTLFSMKNGNVSAFVRTGYGFMIGGSISSNSTISVFSSLPISLGDIESSIGGEYVVNSSPTIFYPSVTVTYKIADFLPYVSYYYENHIPVVHLGFVKGEMNMDANVTIESTPDTSLNFKYFGPFGVFGSTVGLKGQTYSADLAFSSKPVGFDPLQFSFDTNAYINSNGYYEVSGKIDATFKLFFSYISTWVKGTFNGIDKPVFSYGLEMGF